MTDQELIGRCMHLWNTAITLNPAAQRHPCAAVRQHAKDVEANVRRLAKGIPAPYGSAIQIALLDGYLSEAKDGVPTCTPDSMDNLTQYLLFWEKY